MSDGERPDGEDVTDEGESVPPDTVERRLDEVAESADAADTEAALDSVEGRLDDIEADIMDIRFESTDDEDPAATLTDRIDGLRDDIGSQRGPYAEDIVDGIADARHTVTTVEWTDKGLATVATAVQRFVKTAGEQLGDPLTVDTANSETLSTGLSDLSGRIGSAELHPDADAETIATLLAGTDNLQTALDDAQVFDDLEIREQLKRRGFYDVLTPQNRRDFPPEWNAIKLYEARGEVEPILLAMDVFDSEFMQENALDALEHLAPAAAFDDVQALAQRHNKQSVRILGRIGDERACEMLQDALGGRDVELEKTTLWALGCIGSKESVEPVAQRLVADNPEVRSAAARALGLLGDTRSIDPLADRIAADDDERVRASAAWALNQIGTERALNAVADYTDDRSYLVQAEAEKATGF